MRINNKVRMSTKQTSPSSGKNKILYQVGARLEAMDFTLNWYAAKICRVDVKERKVLIHFEGWNHRYDEWINFDSERLRPHARQPLHQDFKDEKEVCDYQDWKVGDRVLAKWQDGKFYPGKIVKPPHDGVYEVLFYDGIKKSVHRVNIKVDTKKLTMMPSDKLELDREMQERKERRQLMANARAERARKRSAEVSPTPPVVPVKRRDGRNKKGKVHENKEETAVSSDVPQVDEVLQDPGNKLNIKNKEEFIKSAESTSEEVRDKNTEESLKNTNKAESRLTCITRHRAVPVCRQDKDNSMNMLTETEEDNEVNLEIKNGKESDESKKNVVSALPVKEELKELLNVQGGWETNSASEEIRHGSKSVNQEDNKIQVKTCTMEMEIKMKPQNTFPSVEGNEFSYDASNCDSNISADLQQEQSELVTVAPKLETENNMDSKHSEYPVHKLKISKGPKIKRTLSKAERLSRARKAKSALAMKMSSKGGSMKAILPTRHGDIPEGGSTPTGTINSCVKAEKTVQRRKSSKGSRSSSISPRGYGYSMAFMDMEKPTVSVVKQGPDTEESTPDNSLTDNSSQSLACAPTSPASSAGTPSENQPAPKKQTYQAKKFRLDQITGKLSAQRQSEAQAAANSPSAFQLAKHSSPHPPPPNPSPSPPPNQPPPYPIETYPPTGPPPLIYSPMARSCCPTPPHQHMYGAHPGHGMHLPAGRMPPHLEFPPPSSGYMLYAHRMNYTPRPPPLPPRPCMGQCSCSAGVQQPVYHPLPPGASHPPHGSHESALAQLMQCEQRILHSAPGMPHYREAGPPPRPWLTHRHGPSPNQPFIPVNHRSDDLWHAHEEKPLQSSPVSQALPAASSSSPTLDNVKNSNRRSRKNERPLPTKALPGSTVLCSESSSAPSSKDLENAPAIEKPTVHPHQHETTDMSASKPDTSITNVAQQSKMSTCGHLPTVPSPVVSAADNGAITDLSPVGAVPGTAGQDNPMLLSSFPSAGNFKNRKGKEPAPKELVIEIDHNKYKCKVLGCDKSFRKESGLEYHIKYYHEQQAGVKRKKSLSLRSDSTPETSPEFGSRGVNKRRIHRSSAPAQLSGSANPTSEPAETELSEVYRSVSMDSEPSVNQDTDLEIEGGGVEVETIDLGMIENVEVEEEEDINGDVIRCMCNEIEEGGFMIQCEQCLTWQHSECVGLSEVTVPPNYLCYVCANPRGLRRSAKFKNDFDWFRRGTLACMPFVSVKEPEYTAELNLATHSLIGDLHDVNNCLRGLKLKFELLRNPSHPDLKYWCKPKEKSPTASTEAREQPSANSQPGDVVMTEEGKGLRALVNGHQENGLVKVKQERPTTPSTSESTNGDSNNNIDGKEVSLLTNTNSESLSTATNFASETRTQLRSELSESGALKKEEEPLSPIPALVPVGGQGPYVISTHSNDQKKSELTSNKKSPNFQPVIKACTRDTQETEQLEKINTSGVCLSDTKPPGTSDTYLKQENDSIVITQGGANTGNNVTETRELSQQSLSDDEEVGAMNNLLGDIGQMQDDLEVRMDEVERQLEVLEDAYGGTPSQLVKKTDFRKLVKDLSRVTRILQQVN